MYREQSTECSVPTIKKGKVNIMRYTITGTDVTGNITFWEETNEIKSAEEKFMTACLKCSKVSVYDKEEYTNIMNY